MKGTSLVVAFATILGCACGAGDNRLDPSDLELRDLLGIAPKVAAGWDAEQRASARRVLATGLDEDAIPTRIALANGRDLDERVARSIAALDRERASGGADALGVVRAAVGSDQLTAVGFAAPNAAQLAETGEKPGTASAIELVLAESWEAGTTLPGRGVALLRAIAVDAGHAGGEIIVVPAPRLAAIAAYVEARDPERPRLIVNPVMLAALEPLSGESVTTASLPRVAPNIAGATTTVSPFAQVRTGTRGTTDPVGGASDPDPNAGNPYSFYGSVAECAYAERTRCEGCLPGGNCEAVTDADGNTECETLALNDGRGYFLLCANLSLAITSVNGCTGRAASACPRDPDAANSLDELENNARFIDDAICAAALDSCLAEIFGSGGTFPGLDGGVAPEPPRSTEVACNDSCSKDDNSNCDSKTNCGDCSGVSCGNSFSCDSACSNSNDQSGCGGNCDACESESGGGDNTCGDDGGGGGGGCGGDGTDGESGCGGNDSGDSGCGGGDSGGCGGDSSGGGGCGNDDSSGGGGCGGSDSSSGGGCGGSDSSSSGGGCGGGDSGGGGGGGCGGGSGGGGGGGSSGSSGCSAARREPGHGLVLAISLVWAVLPVPFAAFVRRRERKRKQPRATEAATETEDVPGDDATGGAP